MRKLPNIIRVLICCLLIGGYGAMYAGSITHDPGHSSEFAKHAQRTADAKALDTDDGSTHLELGCFFCSHAPVISDDHEVEQVWSPSVASLAPPVERTVAIHSRSITLPALRGPPTA